MDETAKAPARRRAMRVRTQKQAAAAVGRIGAAQVQLSRLKASLEVTVAQANLAYENAVAPLRKAIDADTELLRGYFDANRSSLLTGDKKSVALTTGTIGLRKTASKIVVADANSLLALLQQDDALRRFVRSKTETVVDIAALGAEPNVAATIPGVSVEGGTDAFFVKPLMVGAP